ncbi:MAG TPA: glycerophosphodiester phosphodiesterase, partial [Ktedonobacteraceae bacterium]
IPTLREVLDLARDHAHVYVEIKHGKRDKNYGSYPHIAEKVIEEVQSAAMLDQVLIISFDWIVLPLVKSIEPNLLTGALVSSEVWNTGNLQAFEILISQATALRCNWINMDRRLFTPTMPTIAHQHGFKFGVWTVNRAAEFKRLAALGVDSLTSDRPDLFPHFS